MAGNEINCTELSEDKNKKNVKLKNVRENEIKQAEERDTQKIESPQKEENTKLEKARENEIKPAEENDVAKIGSPQKEEMKGVSVRLEIKEKKKFLLKGICYACGELISLNKLGRRCSKCTRTLHSKCTNKTFFSAVFVCNKCVGLVNIL